jgi:iron complex outermembrane receptor protein
MKRFILAGLLAVAPVLSANAEQTPAAGEGGATLSGQVTTRDDGAPVPGATVSIPSLNLSAVTDPAGRYSLSVPADAVKGTVEVQVAASGLRPRTTSLKLAPGATSLDFALVVGFHEEVVVGSRASGTQAEKAVPVDILTSRQIEAIGASETMAVIQALAPSFNFPRPTIADGTDSIRPATLRGLGPDHVLVLVNGKRRHPTALVHVNNTVGRGSTGVDLNAIPVSAIERIEILRDGAAAQYGSDAIAGVINIVLKSGAQPLALQARGGFNTGSYQEVSGQERDFTDGGVEDFSAGHGWKLRRGSVFLTTEYRKRDGTNRAGADTRDQIRAGDAGQNDVPQPNTHWGDSKEKNYLAFLNAELTLGEDQSSSTSAYAFGGWSRRTGVHGGNYRRGLDTTNWPTLYPKGFLPLIEPTVADYSGTVGVRRAGKWFLDVSAELGHNRMDFDITNSLNVSLGPLSPPNHSTFYSGAIAADQFVANADVSRPLEVGLAGPVNVAFGAEFRRESYRIFAGEPDSWRDGGVRNQAGGPATPGAQVFPGFRPANELDVARRNVAAYVDVEGDVAAKLRVGVAGRFENYGDIDDALGNAPSQQGFGSTVDGKLTVRVEAHKRAVLRAAASTGFRAPSLAQSWFSTVSTNFTLVGGTFVPVEVGTFPVSSQQARILGARDLTAEESVNLSGGFVLNPVDPLEVTVDFYRIRIDDRIVLSENFTGGRLTTLLQPLGASAARYFTNGVDTRTQGFDLLANYRFGISGGHAVRLQAAYNHTETKVLRVAATPPELADFLAQSAFEAILFNDSARRRFTCGQPKDNVRLTADWARGGWSALLRQSRFGEYCSIEDRPSPTAIPQVFPAEWVTDLELAYRRDKLSVGIGAENLFGVLPDTQVAGTAFNNIRTFPRNAPFGFNGRFFYAKLTLRL